MKSTQRLYHYTNLESMLGIFTQEQIWMTDCRFCNDKKEIISILTRAMRHWHNNPRWKAIWKKFNLNQTESLNITEYLNISIAEANVPVFCMSKRSDTLSQWRAYANNGAGVCLGFDVPNKLEAEDYEQNYIRLIECIYEESINFDNILSELEKQNSPYELSERLLGHALKYKNVHFKEEEEVRVVVLGGQRRNYFRSLNNRIIPFAKSDDVYRQLTLQEIIIGPKLDIEEMMRALEMLFIQKASLAAEERNAKMENSDCHVDDYYINRAHHELSIKPQFFDCGLQ